MMALALAWVAISLVVTTMALQSLFATNIERTMRADMSAALTRLAAVIMPDVQVPAISTPLPDPLYSTPLSGKYWQIEALDTGAITRSRSLWDLVLQVPDVQDGSEVLTHVDGPDHGHVLLLTRRLELASSAGPRLYLVTVGEDHAPVDAAIASFNAEAASLVTLLGCLLILAAWLQILLGLSPLRTIRQGIEAVHRHGAARLQGKFPSELEPLVEEVNALLVAREHTVERARTRAADLAHGLKTPLAALHGVAERLRERGSSGDAQAIDELAFEMSERIDHQLRLSALHERTGTHTASAPLNSAVLRPLAVLKKTGHGENLHWVVELGDDCQVDLHRQDLLELVGIVLENAAKWARSSVHVRGRQQGGKAILTVEDDGPGIDEAKLSTLGKRGVRLDETKPGTGLGLAMAAEILELNGGSVAYERASTGGLKVTITLPLAEPI
jgi:signal transduction histidine kinase